jgi:lipopolysaccharide export system permease protein
MHTLPRYVLIELIKFFIAFVTALTTLILTVVVFRESLDRGLPLTWVPWLLPYLLPQALQASLPATLLLATTFVYGRMSGANEVVALKALGVSPWAILSPAYVLAILLSLGTFCIYDLAVSWGRSGLERVATDALEEIAYSMLRTQQCFSVKGFAIHVKRVEGRKLLKMTLSVGGGGRGPNTVITAEEAELRSDPANNMLKVLFRDGKIDVQGRLTAYIPGYDEWSIPLRDPTKEGDSVQPSGLPIRVIPGKIEEQREQIRDYREAMAAQAAMAMVLGDFGELTAAAWSGHVEQMKGLNSRLNRLQAESPRRWCWGFSCFFFVWVGAPMAIWLRNSDYLTSFFLCFLPILVIYYPVMIFLTDAAKSGSLPAWSVWFDNILLFLLGLHLLRKVMRY